VSTPRSLGAFLVLALAASGCEWVAGIKDRKVSDGSVLGRDANPNLGDGAATGGSSGTGGVYGGDGGPGIVDAPGTGGGIDTGGATGTGGVTGAGGAATSDAGSGGVIGTGGVDASVVTGGMTGTGGVTRAGGAGSGGLGAGGVTGTGGIGGGSATGGVTGTGGVTRAGGAGSGGLGAGGVTGTGGIGGGSATGGVTGTGGLTTTGGAGGGVTGTGGSNLDAGSGGTGGSGSGGTGTGGAGTGGAGPGDAGIDGPMAPDAPTAPDGGTPPSCSGAFVFDDFSGAALDTSKWGTITSVPQGNASVVQTGGHVEISNRGYLNTIGQFVPAAGGVRVTGKWTFDVSGASDDFLQVLTRTDGIPDSQFGEAQAGIECHATMASSTVVVDGWGTTVSNATSSGSFPINQGDTLIFEMTDDGSLVTCAFVNLTSGNRATASATSTFAPTTNRITFHNREFEVGTNRALVDDLTIESGFVNRPAHHYLFEEASGPTAYDLSGAVNGTLAAGASRVAAILGPGVVLAGTSDSYVDLGTVASSLGTSDFTIAFWFKVPDTTHEIDLFGNRTVGTHGNYLGIRLRADGSVSAELDQDVNATNYQTLAGGASLDDDRWHHFALRRSGMTLALFIDGALVTADTRTTGTPTDLSSGASLRLGSSAIAATYNLMTTGTFDDVRVYNSALADCDIALVGARP